MPGFAQLDASDSRVLLDGFGCRLLADYFEGAFEQKVLRLIAWDVVLCLHFWIWRGEKVGWPSCADGGGDKGSGVNAGVDRRCDK